MLKNCVVTSCHGKEAFETGAKAARAAKAIRQRKNHVHGISHYRCAYCNKFHIGHGGKPLGLHRPVKGFTVIWDRE